MASCKASIRDEDAINQHIVILTAILVSYVCEVGNVFKWGDWPLEEEEVHS